MKKINQIYFVVGPLLLLGWGCSGKAVRTNVDMGLRVEPVYFSPNGDGLKDETFFYPILNSSHEVTRWRLEIFNSKGKRVERLNGAGLPSLINWKGLDGSGKPVKDDTYEGVLRIWGNGFKHKNQGVRVVVDNMPPVAMVSLSTDTLAMNQAGGASLEIRPNVDDGSPLDHWVVRVRDSSGNDVFVFESSGAVQPVKWDGRNAKTGVLVSKGEYSVQLEVLDRAENKSESIPAAIKVNVSTQEMLESALQYISIYETDIGLIVQLPAEDVFWFKDKKPQLTQAGEVLMREVGILVNAYPQVDVQIDGYSWSLPSGQADRDRSSLYAWSVYSYLVKQANVQGSRLKVKGRGRSPLFSRREFDDPPNFVVVKNGVEVILEGNRDWSR